MKSSLKKSFSIIELIFVIAVLGIIAAVALPKLMDSRSTAIVTAIKQDISTITTSIQSYYMINNKIEKISDSVNINPSIWKISNLQVEYISENNTCIDIVIRANELDVIIDEKSSAICQKIYDSGIRNVSYELY